LLKAIKKETGTSMVLITHDMGIVADMTNRVTVLYAGRVAEVAETLTIYRNPLHPYTQALLKAVPRVDEKMSLEPIPGNVPNLIYPPSGCRFHPRCKYATQICKDKVPSLEEAHAGHLVACHHWRELS